MFSQKFTPRKAQSVLKEPHIELRFCSPARLSEVTERDSIIIRRRAEYNLTLPPCPLDIKVVCPSQKCVPRNTASGNSYI